MLKKFIAIATLLIFTANVFAGDFTKTSGGIVVHPGASFAGGAKEVQWKVVAGNIIRVLVVRGKALKFDTGLAVL